MSLHRSDTGNVLATTSADGKVSLWKEGTDGVWKSIQTVDAWAISICLLMYEACIRSITWCLYCMVQMNRWSVGEYPYCECMSYRHMFDHVSQTLNPWYKWTDGMWKSAWTWGQCIKPAMALHQNTHISKCLSTYLNACIPRTNMFAWHKQVCMREALRMWTSSRGAMHV